MKAIAAMSATGRVIGLGGKIPWHLPEDFRWFKERTLGQVVLMGRKTFASLGNKPLPGRENLVLTRSGEPIPGATVLRDPEDLRPEDYAPREIWLIGGAEIYALLLPQCSDLYLSMVRYDGPGDAYFPPFEELFEFREVVRRYSEFEVHHYQRRGTI